MQIPKGSKGWFFLLAVVALALGVVACGGDSEPVHPAPSASRPEPPDDQDVDIEPGSISAGNTLNASLVQNDLLPPQVFGTIAKGENFTWTAVDKSVSRLQSITIYAQNADGTKDPNNYLMLQKSGTTLKWTRTGPSGEVTLAPYVPSEHEGDCFLMSQNLQPFFVSGDAVSYKKLDNGTGSGTLKASGGETPKVKLKVTLAAGTLCAPSG